MRSRGVPHRWALTDLSCPVLPGPGEKLLPPSPCAARAPVPPEACLAPVSLSGNAEALHTSEAASLIGRPSNLPGPQLGGEAEASARPVWPRWAGDAFIRHKNLNLGKRFLFRAGKLGHL